MELPAPPRGQTIPERTRVLLVLLGLAAGVALLLGPDLQREITRRWPAGPGAPAPKLPAELPVVEMNVSFKSMARLKYVRQRALDLGVLVRHEDDWVKAGLDAFGHHVDARIRLKGDATDHFRDEQRWSFRVKVRGGQTLSGQRVFSLQRPDTRQGIWQPVFYDAMRREDVLAPRYQFVQMRLNDRDLGPYAWEEHFAKHLLESHQRREGPIVRASEVTYWAEWANIRERGFPLPDLYEPLLPPGAAVDRAESAAFDDPAKQPDETARRLLLDAVGAFDTVRRGRLPASEVVHLEHTARYLALIDLFGAEHAARFGNVPFYRDPVTGRFEPIAYDAFGGDLSWHHNPLFTRYPFPTTPAQKNEPGLFVSMFADRAFVRAYVAAATRVSRPSYVTALTDWMRGYAPQAAAIGDGSLDALIERVEHNAAIMRAHLEVAVPARASEQPGGGLAVRNVSWREIWVHGVVRGGCRELLPAPVSVTGVPVAESPRVVFVDGFVRADCGEDAAPGPQLLYRLDGDDTLRRLPLHPFSEDRDVAGLAPSTTAPPPGLVKVDGGWAVPPQAQVVVDRLVVLPRGHRLVMGPGAGLDIRGAGHVVVRGPLEIDGTADAPAQVFSSDGQGGGLVVQGPGASHVRYAQFANLGAHTAHGLNVTGGLTFIEGTVELREVRIERARSEDALNLVRAKIDIEGLTVRDTHADAVDIDFAPGRLAGLTFENCGNDCIDISGAKVDIRKVTIQGAGDKALSVGEQGEALVHAMNAVHVRVGFAAKDSAQITLRESFVADAAVGAAAYQKKPEFGPGRIVMAHMRLRDVDHPLWLEEGAFISLDGTVATKTVPPGVADRIAEVTRQAGP